MFKARNGGRVQQIKNKKSYEIVLCLRSVCLFSLISHQRRYYLACLSKKIN